MNTPMMKCGHAANAMVKTHDGEKPCCAICTGPEAFIVDDAPPSLDGRKSKCAQCGKIVDSRTDLPFFEYRGPGSDRATKQCKCCGYFKIAHEDHAGRINVVAQGKCKGFEPHGGYEFDSHYDGCRGWD